MTDAAAATIPASRRGGARKGAGRRSSYSPEIAVQLLVYVDATPVPSLKGFCALYGLDPKQLRRWELRYPDLINAIGALRYKVDIARGRAA